MEKINKDNDFEIMVNRLSSEIIDGWISSTFKKTKDTIRFHKSEQEYHGKYYNKDAQNFIGNCTMNHRISVTLKGYPICNEFILRENVKYISHGDRKYYLSELKDTIRSSHFVDIEKMIELDSNSEDFLNLWEEIVDQRIKYF
jgi:hypothetical protein